MTYCDCGNPAKYYPLIQGQQTPLCADCYAVEFPERVATFDLARRNPAAGEFRDPGLLSER